MVAEDPLLLKIEQILPDLVVAGVEIVAAGIGRNEGVVADGVKRAPHRGILLVRVHDGHRNVQILRVAEQIIDLLHQHVGGIEDDHHDRAQSDDHKHAAQKACDGLPQRLLHPSAGIKYLADDRRDRESKRQGNADERHAPIDVIDGVVVEKDID